MPRAVDLSSRSTNPPTLDGESLCVRECGAARSRCEWLRDSPWGGHLSFVAAGNAAGPTATAAGPGSHYGPHQHLILSLFSPCTQRISHSKPFKIRVQLIQLISERPVVCLPEREIFLFFFYCPSGGGHAQGASFSATMCSSNSPINLVQISPFRPRPSACLVFLVPASCSSCGFF